MLVVRVVLIGVVVMVEDRVVELELGRDEEEDGSTVLVDEGIKDEVVWSGLEENSTELEDPSADEEVRLSS